MLESERRIQTFQTNRRDALKNIGSQSFLLHQVDRLLRRKESDLFVRFHIGNDLTDRKMIWMHVADKDGIHIVVWGDARHQVLPHRFRDHLIGAKSVWIERVKQNGGVPIADHNPFISKISGLRGGLWMSQSDP